VLHGWDSTDGLAEGWLQWISCDTRKPIQSPLYSKDQFVLSECYILSSILGTKDMVRYKKAKIFVLKKQRGDNGRK